MNLKAICKAAIFCLGFAAFIAHAQQPQTILPFKTLAKHSQCEPPQRKEYVIRTQADWEKLYQQVYGERLSAKAARSDSALLKIDFAKQMIIAVFQGQKPSGGYSIEITKLVRNGKRLEVFIEEKSPGKNCFTTQVITHPHHLIVTEKCDRKVVFTRRQITVDC